MLYSFSILGDKVKMKEQFINIQHTEAWFYLIHNTFAEGYLLLDLQTNKWSFFLH